MTTKTKSIWGVIIAVFAVCLALTLPYVTALADENGDSEAAEVSLDSDAVIYDAANFANMAGRTAQEVKSKYWDAYKAGATYINNDSDSYYLVKASTSAPYNEGVLSPDTLTAMEAMSNYYRWLIGAEPLSVNAENDASLQYQALDRNFEWNHSISQSSKPADMPQDLWDLGYAVRHNILASGYTPQGAVTGWLNEGYSLYYGSWDTIGHRTAIIHPAWTEISYGYSGSIAIGRDDASGNYFPNAFAAFPAPGYMPSEVISRNAASWTVRLRTSIVKANYPDNVVIKVTNPATGYSYTCTKANSKAQISNELLNFVQPNDGASISSPYTGSYNVEITGLTDTATNDAAVIRYTVNFFSISDNSISNYSIILPQEEYEYTGSTIVPSFQLRGGANLTAGVDYDTEIFNNVNEGRAVICVTGKGNYCGSVKKAFTIRARSNNIADTTITMPTSYNRYTGNEVRPNVVVTSFGETLVEGTDYQLTYNNNIEVGQALVTVTGIGNYVGSATKTFQIYKAAQLMNHNINTDVEVGYTQKIEVTDYVGELTLTSMNPDIVTIDADGNMIAIANGSARIAISASGDAHYSEANAYVTVRVAVGNHVFETISLANGDNNVARRKCISCGYEEDFTTMTGFSLWWCKGDSGASYMETNVNEGSSYYVLLRSSTPFNVDDTELELVSSDDSIIAIDGYTFTFVGAGKATLTVRAKNNPTVSTRMNYTVSHVFAGEPVTIPASCTTEGSVSNVCTVCHKEAVVETIPAKGHTPRAESIRDKEVNPSCAVDGHYDEVVFCDVCLEEVSRTTVVIPAAGHTPRAESIRDNEVAPSCAIDGHYDEVVFCNVCLEEVSRNTVTVPALGHTPLAPIQDNVINSTCTEEGSYDEVVICGVCFEEVSRETKVLGKNVHLLQKTDGCKSTCYEDGWSAYWQCMNCFKFFSDENGENEIAEGSWIIKSSHDLHKVEGFAATCTEEGQKDYWKCDICGKFFADAEGKQELAAGDLSIAALGHKFGNFVPDGNATCTSDGTMTAKCERCDETKTISDRGSILGHDRINHEAKEATCTEAGWAAYVTCSRCDYTTFAEIPAMGHHMKKTAGEAPTCTEAGTVDYWYCDRCDKYFADAEGSQEIEKDSWKVEALGHAPLAAVRENEIGSSCEDHGSYDEVVYCERCDAELSRETFEVDILGHNFVDYISDENATCTEDGTLTAKCERCDAIDTIEDEGSALGHDYVDYKFNYDATCLEDGTMTGKCSRCEEEDTIVAERSALGHDIIAHEGQEASCENAGWKAYDTCSRCDYSTYEEIAALGHDWGEGTVTKKPTLTETGCKTSVCSRCCTELVEEIEKLKDTQNHPDGLANNASADGNWYYFRNNQVATDVTTVTNNSIGWWYVKNGKVDFGYTGLGINDIGTWYCENGRVTFNYNGFCSDANGDWYIEGSQVKYNKTDVVYGTVQGVSAWWNVVYGKVEVGPTVAHNSNGWWYIDEEGKVDFDFEGIAPNANGIWYCKNGKVDFDYKGFASVGTITAYFEGGQFQSYKNEVIYGNVNGEEAWWNVEGGLVTPGPTVSYNSNGWWYIDKDGKVDFDFTGLADNANGTWYCQKGKVNFDKTDVLYASYNGVEAWWNIGGGALKAGPTVAHNSLGWWYIDKTGKVDFNFKGIASNNIGTWYLENGKVNFDFNGTYGGKTIKGGQVIG